MARSSMRALASLLVTTGALSSGCGGSLRPSKANAPTTSSAAEPSPEASSATENAPKRKPTMDELRAQAMQSCAQDPSMTKFCECRWSALSTELTADELTAPEVSREKLEALRARVRKECSKTLDEGVIRKAFMNGCVKSDESHRPICECVWPKLRKSVELSDFADPKLPESPSFKALVDESVHACAGAGGEKAARASFMHACAEKPSLGPYCACAWKELRARLTVNQIATESDPPSETFKAAAVAARGACAGLRQDTK